MTYDSRVVSRCGRNRNMTRRSKVKVLCYDEVFAVNISRTC